MVCFKGKVQVPIADRYRHLGNVTLGRSAYAPENSSRVGSSASSLKNSRFTISSPYICTKAKVLHAQALTLSRLSYNVASPSSLALAEEVGSDVH